MGNGNGRQSFVKNHWAAEFRLVTRERGGGHGKGAAPKGQEGLTKDWRKEAFLKKRKLEPGAQEVLSNCIKWTPLDAARVEHLSGAPWLCGQH